jgi:hypothetical protein
MLLRVSLLILFTLFIVSALNQTHHFELFCLI